jgi:Amt family ammonium transporter
VLIVLAYSGGATFVILKALALVMPLRITGRVEGVGLDVTQHGEEAYTAGDGAILVRPKTAAIPHGVADVMAAESGGGL